MPGGRGCSPHTQSKEDLLPAQRHCVWGEWACARRVRRLLGLRLGKVPWARQGLLEKGATGWIREQWDMAEPPEVGIHFR